MKLDVPYKLIGKIEKNLIDEFLININEEDWYYFDYRKSMNGMNDCNSILLRHSSEYTSATIREMPLFNKYEPYLKKILNKLNEFYTYKDYVAFISRLNSNGIIDLHKDSGEFLEQIHRIHIPLQTNSDCFYLVDDIFLNMKTENIYEIDNMRTHGVKNNGDNYRIHLVVNLYPQEK